MLDQPECPQRAQSQSIIADPKPKRANDDKHNYIEPGAQTKGRKKSVEQYHPSVKDSLLIKRLNKL